MEQAWQCDMQQKRGHTSHDWTLRLENRGNSHPADCVKEASFVAIKEFCNPRKREKDPRIHLEWFGETRMETLCKHALCD